MHVRLPNVGMHAVDGYSSQQSALAEQRAARLRKRLLNADSLLDSETTEEESLILSHWLNAPADAQNTRVSLPTDYNPDEEHDGRIDLLG